MLTFNLEKRWYDRIASGEKRIEYREVKPYWTIRINNVLAAKVDGHLVVPFTPGLSAESVDLQNADIKCILRLGYTKKCMTARITQIEIVDGKDTDLKIDKPVYAIHFELEEKKNDES